ncbi:MAG: hypothetical protein IJ105_04110 [Bacilli bacterium]|nr:hypothetical protein [Bacilli bacterium]
MKENYEIVIEDNDEYKIKIEATDVKDAVEKFKKFINLCYKKEIFLEELPEDDEEIEVLSEDDFVVDEELDDLDDLYDEEISNILFGSNKPRRAIIVDFE